MEGEAISKLLRFSNAAVLIGLSLSQIMGFVFFLLRRDLRWGGGGGDLIFWSSDKFHGGSKKGRKGESNVPRLSFFNVICDYELLLYERKTLKTNWLPM